MKKAVISILLAAAVLWSLTACGSQTNSDMDELVARIYEVSDGESTDAYLKYENPISGKGEITEASEISRERTVEILDHQLSLKYDHSVHYPLGDCRYDYYSIADDAGEGTVYFKPDGTWGGISNYPIVRLTTTAESTPEEIYEMLKKALGSIVDFSKHTTWTVEELGVEGSNTFCFDIGVTDQGYITQWVRILVAADGTVNTVNFSGPEDTQSLNLTVDKELETALIAEKVKRMAGKGMSYVSHSLMDTPHLLMYKGQLVIAYDIRVELTGSDVGKYPFTARLVIPAEVLQKSA